MTLKHEIEDLLKPYSGTYKFDDNSTSDGVTILPIDDKNTSGDIFNSTVNFLIKNINLINAKAKPHKNSDQGNRSYDLIFIFREIKTGKPGFI